MRFGECFSANVDISDIHHVLEIGEVIEEYSEDTPHPSRLMLGWCSGRPLHLMAAYDEEKQETIIITVYEPDPDKWELDFKKRKL